MYRFFLFISFFASVNCFSQFPLTGRDSTIKGPQDFAIVMGISHYRYVRPLSYADKDAELFRDWLKSPAGGKLKEGNIFTLLNEEGNNANFWGKGFQWLKSKQLQRGDKLFIYLAGHGDAIDEDQYFFLGVDCKPDGDKNNYLISGAIQLFNLKKKIANETAKGVDVVFIMNACRSNELPGGTPGQNFLNTAVSQKQAGEIMMLATAAGQVSLEDASIGNGHGLFTWYLVDGLTGMADAGRPDRKITFGEIRSYVDNQVASLALQKFKRKQEPYFCCNENSEKVISLVDTAYLQQWLRIKKQIERRSGGNAVPEERTTVNSFTADTLLIETYNRFNQAIRLNRITGKNSAEDFFEQLNKKYPGNPYTFDAKSSLAVQFANIAQSRVNRYLDCLEDLSAAEKQSNFEAAVNLSKAIATFIDIDVDFARSMANRASLLFSLGDYGPRGKNGNFQDALNFAHLCKNIDPGGAFAYNRLSQIFIELKNSDSAIYYATRGVELAPNWPCALTTLAKARNITTAASNPVTTASTVKNKKLSVGYFLAGGINRPEKAFIPNPNSVILAADPATKPHLDFGFFIYQRLLEKLDFIPSLGMSFQTTGFEVQRRNPAGGANISDSINTAEMSIHFSPSVRYHPSSKKVSPFVRIGPGLSYSISQKNAPAGTLAYKDFSALIELGAGIDFPLKKSRFILSPEMHYIKELTDRKIDNGTVYSQALSGLRRNGVMLGVFVRWK